MVDEQTGGFIPGVGFRPGSDSGSSSDDSQQALQEETSTGSVETNEEDASADDTFSERDLDRGKDRVDVGGASVGPGVGTKSTGENTNLDPDDSTETTFEENTFEESTSSGSFETEETTPDPTRAENETEEQSLADQQGAETESPQAAKLEEQVTEETGLSQRDVAIQEFGDRLRPTLTERGLEKRAAKRFGSNLTSEDVEVEDGRVRAVSQEADRGRDLLAIENQVRSQFEDAENISIDRTGQDQFVARVVTEEGRTVRRTFATSEQAQERLESEAALAEATNRFVDGPSITGGGSGEAEQQAREQAREAVQERFPGFREGQEFNVETERTVSGVSASVEFTEAGRARATRTLLRQETPEDQIPESATERQRELFREDFQGQIEETDSGLDISRTNRAIGNIPNTEEGRKFLEGLDRQSEFIRENVVSPVAEASSQVNPVVLGERLRAELQQSESEQSFQDFVTGEGQEEGTAERTSEAFVEGAGTVIDVPGAVGGLVRAGDFVGAGLEASPVGQTAGRLAGQEQETNLDEFTTQSGIEAERVTSQFVSAAESRPFETGARVGGSLAGSFALSRGASAISETAGRAAPFAFQPVEELVTRGATAGLRRTSTGARALDRVGGTLDPDDLAIRGAQRAASAVRGASLRGGIRAGREFVSRGGESRAQLGGGQGPSLKFEQRGDVSVEQEIDRLKTPEEISREIEQENERLVGGRQKPLRQGPRRANTRIRIAQEPSVRSETELTRRVEPAGLREQQDVSSLELLEQAQQSDVRQSQRGRVRTLEDTRLDQRQEQRVRQDQRQRQDVRQDTRQDIEQEFRFETRVESETETAVDTETRAEATRPPEDFDAVFEEDEDEVEEIFGRTTIANVADPSEILDDL